MSDHSSRLDKITPRLSAFFLACALAGGAAAIIMSSAARAGGPDAEAVTIDTTFIVKTPDVRLDKPAHDARASVILMAGGNGLLKLDPSGTIIDSTGNIPAGPPSAAGANPSGSSAPATAAFRP